MAKIRIEVVLLKTLTSGFLFKIKNHTFANKLTRMPNVSAGIFRMNTMAL